MGEISEKSRALGVTTQVFAIRATYHDTPINPVDVCCDAIESNSCR
jgi:hypothetical protein